jgi:hypothetical protein
MTANTFKKKSHQRPRAPQRQLRIVRVGEFGVRGESLPHTTFEESHEQSSTLPLRSLPLVVISSFFAAQHDKGDDLGFILAASLILSSVGAPTVPPRTALSPTSLYS